MIETREGDASRPLLISARTLHGLRWLVMAASGLMLALFLLSAHRRLHYPYDLEWVEDGNLQELWRVMRHQPLYTAPSIDYVPYLYAPVFFWLAALVARATGPGFAAMRLLSTVASSGVACGLFALVYQEFPSAASTTGRRAPRMLAATLAVGFFLCAYPVTEAFFDLGRVDMVCLCFAMFALLAGRRGLPVLAAGLWVCAFQTKQGILPVALLALCFEWQRPRRIVLGLGTFALLAGASVAWLNHQSGGWYWRYVFGMAGGFPLVPRHIAFFVPHAIFAPFGIAVALVCAALLLTPPAWRSRVTSFYACSGLGMVLFTWYIYAHAGASANAILPAYLYLSMVAGLAVGRMMERLEHSGAVWASAAQATLLLAALAQILMHSYSPGTYYPTADATAEVTGLIADLRHIPGDVLVLEHAEYAVMAGHREFANGEAAIAMMMVSKGQISSGLHQDYADAIRGRKFSAIALDEDPGRAVLTGVWMPPDFYVDYPVKVQLAGLGGYFMTPRPVLLYMPCPGPGRVDPRQLFPKLLVDESGCDGR